MSLLQRAATLVALSLSLIGAAAYAADIDTPAIAVPTMATTSISAVSMIPVPIPPVAMVPTEDGLAAEADTDAGDVVAYPTLAAAVDAQDISEDLDPQLRCLAGAIYYEAKGEPLTGQLAVGEVILNRVASGRFGDNMCDVVTQPGQFSFVRGGRIPPVDPDRAAWRTALAIAKVAVADAWDSTAGKALFFHARRVSPRWNKTRVASIGNHIFYR